MCVATSRWLDTPVRIPAPAWSLMVESLATERHVQFSPGRVERDFEELRTWLRGSGLDADPVVRARLADLAVEVAEVRVLSLVLLEAVEHGRPAVVEAACNKLAGSELAQRIARFAADTGAPESIVEGSVIEFLLRSWLW